MSIRTASSTPSEWGLRGHSCMRLVRESDPIHHSEGTTHQRHAVIFVSLHVQITSHLHYSLDCQSRARTWLHRGIYRPFPSHHLLDHPYPHRVPLVHRQIEDSIAMKFLNFSKRRCDRVQSVSTVSQRARELLTMLLCTSKSAPEYHRP